MNFLSPWLLLLFIPLGAIIVLLYLLKLKRREQVISSIMLWQDAVADIQANAPFQKLKKSLLLFLQLAVLLLLVGAVSRPYMKVRGISENRIVVIMDSSASMQSKDVLPSRFDAAKKKAADLVDRMGPGDTMLVMTAGSKAKVAASFTDDKRRLGGVISQLKCGDTPCNMRQAMLLALSLVGGKSAAPARIVVISDGGFSQLTDLSPRNCKVDFETVGKGCDNVGITGLSSRKTLSGDQQVFVGLQNFSQKEKKFDLEIYLGDQLLDVREVSLRAGEQKQEILSDVSQLSGRIKAVLDIKDDLALDNVGWVFLTGPRKVSVLLVSKGNVFLQNALNLDPRTQLAKTDALPSDYASRDYDLTVFDGVEPPSNLPPGAYILINTACAQSPGEFGESVSKPTIVDYAHHHPLTAYVEFGDTQIGTARVLKPRNWANSVMECADGPLALCGVHAGRRFVQLSWSMLDSDFPLRVAFPIFIANCLDWLIPPEVGGGMSIRTGQPAYIDLPPGVSELNIARPDGESDIAHVSETPATYDGTDRIGLYRTSWKGGSREFACNLASSQESNTNPVNSLVIGSKSYSARGKGIRTNREFYWPLLMLAICILAFEWYAFHRRL